MVESRRYLEPGVIAGQWWHELGDGRLQCDLCPRQCKLREGQRGFCFVRQAREGVIALTSYGRNTGMAVDPIEKKPLNHFLPGSQVLSFGTAGCNLGCRYCQNWGISKAKEMRRLSTEASPNQVAETANAYGCRSVAFTYNDPVVFAEYAIDSARQAHDHGLKTVAVTAGYISPKARREFYRHIDAANVDLKAFDEKYYQELCYGRLDPVLDTLRYLYHETDVWLEITTLLIPGHNDSDEAIDRQIDWLLTNLGPEIPLHFTAFYPAYRMTDLPATPPSTLQRARQQALHAGMQFVYTGNTLDRKGGTTFCPGCGREVIGRAGYRITSYCLDKNGCCHSCGERIPGIFH